jgi:hypothetical protein
MPRQTNQLMSRGSHHIPIVVRHNTFILKWGKYVLAPSTTTMLRFSPLNYQKL